MNNEIKALRSELALLKLQFSERVTQVEERLNTLLTHENTHSNTSQNNVNPLLEADAHNKTLPIKQTNEQVAEQSNLLIKNSAIKNSPITKSDVEQQNTTHKTTDNTAYNNTNNINDNHYNPSQSPSQTIAPPHGVKKAPPAFILFIQSFISTLFSTVLESFFEWTKPVVSIYKSYQEKGMLGIFILVIAGIALVLAGFGYLMQLLIDQLDSGAKSLLMCFAAVTVVGIGIGLKIKTTFSEFATAIVTLGLLLCYCTLYFAGSVYGIIPSVAIVFCYLAIALLCHALATWLETKVVASLGIMGIATMPILSNTVQIEPLYYLLSLAFVAVSSLVFAFKTNEKWLANLTLIFTLLSVEWVVGVATIQVSVWAVNLFYILFFSYAVAALFTHKTPYKNHVIFLTALVGSIVLLFFQSSDLFTTQISVAFVVNMALAATVSVVFYKIKHEVTPFIILLSALWGVLAIVSAVSNTYWGIAWAIEGLLLLYVGRYYLLSFVSNQGQLLITVALIYSWVAIAPYFPLPALNTSSGWVLSIAIVLVIATWQRMISTKGFDHVSQKTIKPFLQCIEVVWLSVLIIGCSTIWLGVWTGVAAIILQACILFRARFCKQLSIEIFAVILIIVPIFYVVQGGLLIDPLVSSYRFSALPLFAKLAIISLFAQLWLWSAFYRKYYPNSVITNIAEVARLVFYLLLPICWLSAAFRRLDENVLLILWCSPAIALFFAQKIQHKFITLETKILTVLASLCFIFIIGQLSLTYSLLSIVGFTAFYGIAFLLNKKTPLALYTFICGCGLISLGFALPNAIGFHTNSVLVAIIAAGIYWSGCLLFIKRSVNIKALQTPIYIINALLVAVSWVLIHFDPFYTLVPIIFLVVLIYRQHDVASLPFVTLVTKNNSHLLIHSVGVITYLSLLSALYEFRLDLLIAPALAIHGATLLFLKNRELTTVRYSFSLIILGITKLALIDAESALLWQKVILFMGIGAFILAASFWYQKIVKKIPLT